MDATQTKLPWEGIVDALEAFAADGVLDAAQARIQVLLDTLICSEDPVPGLTALFDGAAGAVLLPEVAALDLPQPGRKVHKDNLAHSIRVCAQAPRRARVRWAALLHDVGKAPTRKILADKVTFHDHEVVGERLVRKRLRELGYGGSFADEVALLVRHSGRMHGFDDSWTDSTVRRFVVDLNSDQSLVDDALDLARADCTSARPGRIEQVWAEVDAVAGRIAEVQSADAEAAKRPAIDGKRIMELLDLSPGPAVGKAWKWMLSWTEEHPDATGVDAEAALVAWHAGQ